MPYAAIRRKVCDYGVVAQDIMIRFEAELDVQLVSDVEAKVELGVGVDALVAGMDCRIVYFGKGRNRIAYITAGLCYRRYDGGSDTVESREAHGGAAVRGFVVYPESRSPARL